MRVLIIKVRNVTDAEIMEIVIMALTYLVIGIFAVDAPALVGTAYTVSGLIHGRALRDRRQHECQICHGHITEAQAA